MPRDKFVQILDYPENATNIDDVDDDDDNVDGGVLDHFPNPGRVVNPAFDSDAFLLEQIPSNQLQPTSINIEHSSDVTIGNVYNGPVTIVQHQLTNIGGSNTSNLNLGELNVEESDSSGTADVPTKHQTIVSRPALRRTDAVFTGASLFVLLVVSVVTLVVVTKSETIVTVPTTVAQMPPVHMFVSRQKWGSNAAYYPQTKPLEDPIPHVILAYVVTSTCKDLNECRLFLRYGLGKADYLCSFYIGGSDGMIFEGRGWNFVQQFQESFAAVVCFIGNFNDSRVNDDLIEALDDLLQLGVSEGNLDKKYKMNCPKNVARREHCRTFPDGKGCLIPIKV